MNCIKRRFGLELSRAELFRRSVKLKLEGEYKEPGYGHLWIRVWIFQARLGLSHTMDVYGCYGYSDNDVHEFHFVFIQKDYDGFDSGEIEISDGNFDGTLVLIY